MNRHRALWLGMWLGFILATGCSAPRLSPEVHAGFNLTGTWTLDASQSDAPPSATRLVDQMDQELIRGSRDRDLYRQIGDGTVFAFIGQDFPVLLAERMEIDQSRESMGIHYEPGSYRDVSFGEKERGLWTVSAGWNAQGQFIIYSDSDDIRGIETHELLNPSTLQVRLSVRADGGDLDLVRTFVRK